MSKRNKVIIIGNPDTEKRLREIIVSKGSAHGKSELLDWDALKNGTNPYAHHVRGIPFFVSQLAEAWKISPEEAAQKMKEEAQAHRWKSAAYACGFDINSEEEYFKAMAGAPENVAKNPAITSRAWDVCRQIQQLKSHEIDFVMDALLVRAKQLNSLHRVARPPFTDPCKTIEDFIKDLPPQT